MKRARRKFVLYAELAVFVLLTVLLSVINIINFTMAADDADMLTQRISGNHGVFDKTAQEGNNGRFFSEKGRMGPMGPDSPEMNSSIRYFTFSFDKDLNAQKIEFRMSAVDENEAEGWARSLLNESTGWTKGTYRYRVYEDNGLVYVTVIDQGRELLPSYRIFMISVAGEIVVLLLGLLALTYAGKLLFKPFEEAERKQKRFITNVERDFKMPLTIINANTEVIEKQNGPSEQTKSINRQVRKMTGLVKEIAALSLFEEKDLHITKINISNILSVEIDRKKPDFEKKGIELTTDIQPDLYITGDGEAMAKVVSELIENALKFSLAKASFTLVKHKDRLTLTASNDTDLKSGSIDQIFDRFTTLENAEGKEGAGLGLSGFKSIIRAHNGRVSAKVAEGVFTLKADL